MLPDAEFCNEKKPTKPDARRSVILMQDILLLAASKHKKRTFFAPSGCPLIYNLLQAETTKGSVPDQYMMILFRELK